MPISSGSQPATAKPLNAPRGSNPFCSANFESITTTEAAPSESCEALPAVIKCSSPLTGGNPAKPSKVVCGRLHSSLSTV